MSPTTRPGSVSVTTAARARPPARLRDHGRRAAADRGGADDRPTRARPRPPAGRPRCGQAVAEHAGRDADERGAVARAGPARPRPRPRESRSSSAAPSRVSAAASWPAMCATSTAAGRPRRSTAPPRRCAASWPREQPRRRPRAARRPRVVAVVVERRSGGWQLRARVRDGAHAFPVVLLLTDRHGRPVVTAIGGA